MARPAQRKQLLDRIGRRHDRRAGIEAKAILLVDIGATTGPVTLLEQDRVHAGRLQPDGQRQPAKTGTDYHHARRLRHAVPIRLAEGGRQRRARSTGTGGLPLRICRASLMPMRPA